MGTEEGTRSVTATILRDVLARKISRNPSFSLRAFARDLGVSHTYLSLVLNGKKHLSVRKVVEFSQVLGLSEREAQIFVQAGSNESASRKVVSGKFAAITRNRPEKAVEAYFELEADRYRILAEWFHLPILDLTFTEGFDASPNWIAKRLGITPKQVESAIDRLLRLGLLARKEDGTLYKPKSSLLVQPAQPSQVIRSFHLQMIRKASEALEAGTDDDAHTRDFSGVTIPMDPEKIPEARKRILRFRRSLWNFLSSGERTELFQLNIQLFPLTRPASSGKAKGSKRGKLK